MWYGNSLRSRDILAHSDHRWAARTSNPTYSDIVAATNAAVTVFEARNIPICAVGGLACKLFGNPRSPNDTDLLVLNTAMGQEQLKRMLVDADSQFYLVPAKDPRATFKVLWYRMASNVRVKVDLLQPGIMSIPNISSKEIERKSVRTITSSSTKVHLPVAPFGLVLLLKLQAWEQHRDSSESRFQEKHYMDSRDINVLLPLAVAAAVKFDTLPDDFLQEAKRRVISYTQTYPESDERWKQLGFKTFKTQATTRNSTRTLRTSAGASTSTSASTPTRRYTRPSSLSTGEDDISKLLARIRLSSTRPARIATDYDSLFD